MNGQAGTMAVMIIISLGVLGWVLIIARLRREINKWKEKSYSLQQQLISKEKECNIWKNQLEQLQDRNQELEQALLLETEKRAGFQREVQELARIQEELRGCRVAHNRALEEISQLRERCASLETSLEKEMGANSEKLSILRSAGEELKKAFQSLATEALRTNNQIFLDLAKSTFLQFQAEAEASLDSRQKAVEQVIEPLKDMLNRYERELKAMERERQQAYARLSTQAESLSSSQARLISETAKLVKALRQPQVRGRWGEMTLKRVVELAGMSPYCDFTIQPSVGDHDKRLRPDLIVHLPGNRLIVVDAKAPLQSYLEAVETTDESERNEHLAAHARQVRIHMQQLASKSYWAQFSQSPEFVVLFLPGESFFSAALEKDASLIEAGIRQKVILATPTTLIALLRSIAYGWQQQTMAQNAEAICRLGKEFYQRLNRFVRSIQELGKHLERTVAQYNQALGALESRVLVTARKFHELGISEVGPLPELQRIEELPRQLRSTNNGR